MSKDPFFCHARRASILLCALAVGISSCNMPSCENTNPVFNNYTPDKEEYKAELARQINRIGEKNLTHWFDRYHEREEQSFMTLFVQGKDLCAVQEVLVNDWTGIEGIKRAKGMGYSGAELRGLKVSIAQTSSGTSFIYEDVDRIID